MLLLLQSCSCWFCLCCCVTCGTAALLDRLCQDAFIVLCYDLMLLNIIAIWFESKTCGGNELSELRFVECCYRLTWISITYWDKMDCFRKHLMAFMGHLRAWLWLGWRLCYVMSVLCDLMKLHSSCHLKLLGQFWASCDALSLISMPLLSIKMAQKVVIDVIMRTSEKNTLSSQNSDAGSVT